MTMKRLVNGEIVLLTSQEEEEVKRRLEASACFDVRVDRNDKLKESDWTQLADAPVDQAAWAAYRQALRDIPQQDGFPLNVIWPDEP